MAFPRIGGIGSPLNLTGAFGSFNPVTGSATFTTPGSATNAVTLQGGEVYILPAGTFFIQPGPYTSLQFLDPVAAFWRTINADSGIQPVVIDSDGGNFRLANLTGCAVGAIITNTGAGTGVVNGIGTTATGLTVTSSAGGSKWVPVVGGAINSTVTITAGGAGYLYPPLLVFRSPPAGGIPATGFCAISGGTVSAVTVTNQGAGYTTAPTIQVYNDQRDTVGSGAVLTVNSTLANSGLLTALYPSDPGNAVTAVPTFTFSPTSTITATMLMNFVVTGITVVNGGSGYGTAQPYLVISSGGVTTSTRAAGTAGPIADSGITFPRMAQLAGVSGASVIQSSSITIVDAGFGFQVVPTAFVIPGGTAVVLTTIGQANFNVGSIVDTSFVQPM